MTRFSRNHGKQGGFLLLEGLVAILIFSMGVLAIVGMQAAAVTAVRDSKYRADAGLLANEVIGQMWASDRTGATLKANFDSTGSGANYAAWLADVQATLPGVTANSTTAPTLTVNAASGLTTIVVRWQAPNDSTAHSYTTTVQIK